MRHRVIALLFVLAVGSTSLWCAELPACPEKILKDVSKAPDLIPPRTEYNPEGSTDVSFTLDANGIIDGIIFSNWKITPDDSFMREHIRKVVLGWKLEKVSKTCRVRTKVTFKLAEHA